MGMKILNQAVALATEINLPEKAEEAKKQLKEIKAESKNLLVKIFTRITTSIRSTFTFESVAKPKKIETQLKVLYVIAQNSSLPIYEKYFEGEKKFDANLISGLLSAIRTMGETLLEAKAGGLKLIDHGDVAIMLETTGEMVFALVITRETYFAREKLRDFAESFSKSKYAYKKTDGFVLKDKEQKKAIDTMVQKTFQELLK